jgi:hypothetical protein
VPGGFYDERPVGVFTNGIFEWKLAGIYARDIDGLSLRHTEVVWGKPLDVTYGAGLDEASVTNLVVDHASLNPSPPAAPIPDK